MIRQAFWIKSQMTLSKETFRLESCDEVTFIIWKMSYALFHIQVTHLSKARMALVQKLAWKNFDFDHHAYSL